MRCSIVTKAWPELMLIHGPDTDLTNSLLKLSRMDIKTVTGLVTGHCHLQKNLPIVGLNAESPCADFMVLSNKLHNTYP